MGGATLYSHNIRTSLIALSISLVCVEQGLAQAQDTSGTLPETAQPAPPQDSTTAATPPANPVSSPLVSVSPSTLEKAASHHRRRGDGEGIVVTGSRLLNGDPTAHIEVLTAEDIKARGVTSVEELMRTIPQNLNTIGAITNERSKGPLSHPGAGNSAGVSQLGSLGVSAANLGGSGAGNTLILVNGRRMAGAAGIEDGFVNLNAIPLSAIERVEIDMDGSSAVYGADAIGGVINFILKRNYTGTTISAKHEFSANDASVTSVSIASGMAWGSGNFSGTVSYDHRNPVNNYKSGYTTQNYSSFYGGNTAYDQRSFTRGLQPGVIVVPGTAPDYVEQGLSVRPGLTGAPTMNDFVTLDPNSKRDYVPEWAGPKSDTVSGTFNFEQKITDKLKFFANGLYTHSANSQASDYNTGLSVDLAPGQAYNPFPANYFSSYDPGTTVYYFPQAEIASGQIPGAKISNTSDSWTISGGLNYEINRQTKLEFVYTSSSSKSSAHQKTLGSLVSFIADPTSPTGYSCYNFQLARGTYTGANLAAVQAAFNAQCKALTSSDPNVAFNPWHTGGGADISTFLYDDQQEQRSSTQKNFELHLNGNVFDLPAGRIRYAVGGEYNTDGVNSREVNVFTGTAVSRSRYAFFGEMTLPVFGSKFSLPMLRELVFNGALRNDTYLTDGAVGTVNGVPVDQGGQIIYGKSRFSHYTPAYGLRWAPVSDLVFRAKWSSGFRAPPPSQLFNVTGTSTYQTIIFNDPLYTCTTDCSYSAGAYYVPRTTAPNPNLKPQTSTQQNFSAQWTPSGLFNGLSVNVTYNRTRIKNEYANMQDLNSVLTTSQILQIAQFYPRDPVTHKIIAAQNMIFNIAGSEYSSVNIEAHYQINTGLGTFTPSINYLRNLKSQRTIIDGTPAISTLGSVSGVDRYKIQASIPWNYKNLDVTLWAYYTPPYVNNYNVSMYAGYLSGVQDIRPVGSLTTFDLTASWQIRKRLRLNFAGRNIFAAAPPFVVIDSRPYDTARYNAAGRTFSMEIQKSF